MENKSDVASIPNIVICLWLSLLPNLQIGLHLSWGTCPGWCFPPNLCRRGLSAILQAQKLLVIHDMRGCIRTEGFRRSISYKTRVDMEACMIGAACKTYRGFEEMRLSLAGHARV